MTELIIILNVLIGLLFFLIGRRLGAKHTIEKIKKYDFSYRTAPVRWTQRLIEGGYQPVPTQARPVSPPRRL